MDFKSDICFKVAEKCSKTGHQEYIYQINNDVISSEDFNKTILQIAYIIYQYNKKLTLGIKKDNNKIFIATNCKKSANISSMNSNILYYKYKEILQIIPDIKHISNQDYIVELTPTSQIFIIKQ